MQFQALPSFHPLPLDSLRECKSLQKIMRYQKIPLRFDVNVYAALDASPSTRRNNKCPPYVASHRDHVTAKTFSRNLPLSDYVMRTQPQQKRRLQKQEHARERLWKRPLNKHPLLPAR